MCNGFLRFLFKVTYGLKMISTTTLHSIVNPDSEFKSFCKYIVPFLCKNSDNRPQLLFEEMWYIS